MANNNALSDLVTFALGGGLAAVIAAGLKAWTSVRSGIKAGEKETIENIVADRRQAREETEAVRAAARAELAVIRRDLRYQEWVTHQYYRQLVLSGITPDPEYPVAPSERDGSEEDPWSQQQVKKRMEGTG